jgi:transcriptional regulator with GAF, ATPase, and Fis domain
MKQMGWNPAAPGVATPDPPGAAMSPPDADVRTDLEDRLRFERLLVHLASGFVGLPADRVDAAIETAQRRIGETLELDRSSLFQLSPAGEMILTHSWVAPGFEPYPSRINAREHFPWTLQKVLSGEGIRYSSHAELPPEAARDLEAFRQHGPKSTVVFPLAAGGVVFGGLAFGMLREERRWTEDLVARLRLVASLFESTLARKRSEERLHQALAEVRRLQEQLLQEKVYLQQEVKTLHGNGEIIGTSRALREVLAQVDRVAPTEATVLLLGETGTGKELLAEAIHARSPRHNRVLIKVNCAALPPTLIEAELFGREKGAYTGALSRQAGRFELADGSTLFLDEVAELPPDLQAKLLRVLQDGQFERLGGTKTLRVNVRIIAASNRDLATAVTAGSFRGDLYYRLNAFPIVVPPLRERPEDVPALAWSFARQVGHSLGKPVERIPHEVMTELQRYAWPGNVRELRNLIERAIILADSSTLRLPSGPVTERQDASVTLEGVERSHILKMLERTGWRIRGRGGAAEILGLKPTTLEARAKKLGIRRPV